MRLLLDENLPRALAALLRADGHDVADVREIGLTGADDDKVLARAVSDGRVLVSMDRKRFGDEAKTPVGSTPGIVVVRLRQATIGAVCARVSRVLNALRQADVRGQRLIVERARVRRQGKVH